MSISLYEATVPQFLQVLTAIDGLVGKAEAWCNERSIAPSELIDANLAPDMWSFAHQIRASTLHSAGAIKGLQAGLFSPDMSPPPDNFADLRKMVQDAIAYLSGIDSAALHALQDRDMLFELGQYKMDFVGYKFILSFSQPNFFFHSSIAYGILRARGVEVGKLDFLGKVQIKH